MPSSNMPLWNKNYFELKVTEKEEKPEKLPALFLFASKQDIHFQKCPLLSSLPGKTKVNPQM